MMDDEMAEGEAGQPDNDPAGSVELCIQVAADGSLSVYKESSADGEEANTTESPRQDAADIGQALKMVLDMYKQLSANGQQDQFDSGFGMQKAQTDTSGSQRIQRAFR